MVQAKEMARSLESLPVSESSRSHTMAAGYGVLQMPPFPLRIYDTPRDLGEFIGLRTMKNGFELRELDRPPQSWCYVLEDYHA